MPAIVVRMMLALVAVSVIGCAPDPYGNLGGPRHYFEDNRIGSSPDFAIVKWGNIEDHVATVHGAADDLQTCLLIAKGLNEDACRETDGQDCLSPFSCRVLNQ